MNDLLFQAGLAYVDWAIAFNQVEIFRKAADIAKLRLEIMVESFRQGDKPAVDTLETFILWQNRLFDLNESALELANAAQTLETFFWTPGRPFKAGAFCRENNRYSCLIPAKPYLLLRRTS